MPLKKASGMPIAFLFSNSFEDIELLFEPVSQNTGTKRPKGG
jgi:hypothetical protein